MTMDFNDARGAAASAREDSLAEAQPYDIMADRREVVARLAGSDEIEALTATIDVNDLTSIVTFGSKTAEAISGASDAVLRSFNPAQMDESSRMLQALAKIMGQFNIDELRESPTLFGRLFGNARNQLDRVLAKYHTMGDEVDKIYVQLKQYESEIKQSNQKLEAMFQANVGYFHDLEKYIVAGEQGCREIQDYMDQLKAQLAQTGDQSITFELHTLSQALQMLEQRTQDLRTAECVALQSIPMIRAMQFNNMNLVRKINSAFIVTLPVFRQALAQAIMLKRQKIQTDALAALEQRTNEMLLRNAQNTAEQARITARMAADSPIQADTLVGAWQTIMNGIEETRSIQENARAQRLRDQEKLEDIRRDFMARAHRPG